MWCAGLQDMGWKCKVSMMHVPCYEPQAVSCKQVCDQWHPWLLFSLQHLPLPKPVVASKSGTSPKQHFFGILLHRCSAFGQSPMLHSTATCNHTAAPRVYLGIQPADLLYTDDLGSSWSSSGLAATPQSSSWYRMLPPYEPSVRSISSSYISSCQRGHSCGSCDASLQGGAAQHCTGAEVLVGLQVRLCRTAGWTMLLLAVDSCGFE
jgi:hypothetical protein